MTSVKTLRNHYVQNASSLNRLPFYSKWKYIWVLKGLLFKMLLMDAPLDFQEVGSFQKTVPHRFDFNKGTQFLTEKQISHDPSKQANT